MRRIAMKARVTGRVQGVAFRAWTRARATQLGLAGWVRNDGDGSVSALFDGNEDAVQTMIGELWAGPGAASVTDVQSEMADHDPTLTDFRILT